MGLIQLVFPFDAYQAGGALLCLHSAPPPQ